jgi:hypothetical protein
MRAIKLQAQVLAPEARYPRSLSVEEFLAKLSERPHGTRSKEEIDAELLEMRQSWD